MNGEEEVERLPSELQGVARILAPRSVAVVGASRNEKTIGHQILRNIIRHGYQGAVYPVNPSARAICSVRAFPTVASLPEVPDLAMVVVPKEHVLEVVAECGSAGVKGIVVISAGFKEIGAEGAERERQLLEIVRRCDMRMVGPNCMGVVNTAPDISLNATFARAMPPAGHAAFVSQSGALGLSVLDYAREYAIGISRFVSTGNKADVSSNDLLMLWENDPAVKVILMYVESFGNPRNFLEIASRITRHKPIVAVKSGRSRAGTRAAASHTGALASSDSAVDALLAQAGVLRASTVEELFDLAIGFGVRSLPRSRRTVVVTNAGGPGILAADAMEWFGLELTDLSDSTVQKLSGALPQEASIRNPLDMIASASPESYEMALRTVLADESVDAVVPIFVPPFGVSQRQVAEAIAGAAATAPHKPLLAVLMGSDGLPQGRAELHDAGIPAYIFPESAARALAALNRHAEWMAQPAVPDSDHPQLNRKRIAAILSDARAEGRERLSEVEALQLLQACGIPVADYRFAGGADDPADAAEEVGYPLAMKVVSPEIEHKTDAGGVTVGIRDPAELRNSHREMLERIRVRRPDARISGVLLQRMVSGGRETIAGISRDPGFGALVMFGLGGVFVEALHDVVFRIAPLTMQQSRSMLDGIRSRAVLDGVRGEPPVSRDSLAGVIRSLSHLAALEPQIAELDVNPLVAFPDGVIALDARVRLTPAR